MTHHTGSDEGLSEAEREALVKQIKARYRERGIQTNETAFVATIHAAIDVTARAAAPDALRERVEALAAAKDTHLDGESDHSAGFIDGWNAAIDYALRAALADPTDGATT